MPLPITPLLEAVRRRPLTSAGILLLLTGYMFVCIESGNDFETFYDLAQMSLEGSSHIYDVTPRTGMPVAYLPHFALLTMPLALIPFTLSAGLWFWLKCGVAAQIIANLSRWSSRYSSWEKTLHVALPLIVCFNFINNDFRLGQVNLIVHGLVFFSFAALLKGKHALSSLLFVLSSFKLAPLLLLPYFVLRRQWQFLIGTAGWAAILCALLVGWFGWEEIASLPAQVFEASYSSKLAPSELAAVENQSLVGAISRIGTSVVGTETAGSETYMPLAYATSLLLLGGTCLWILGRRSQGPQWSEFGVFIVTMLLVFPQTKTAQMIHLLLPVYLLAASVQWTRFQLRDHWWMLITGIVFAGSGRDLLGRAAFDYSFYLSSHTAVMALLLILLVKRNPEIHALGPDAHLPVNVREPGDG